MKKELKQKLTIVVTAENKMKLEHLAKINKCSMGEMVEKSIETLTSAIPVIEHSAEILRENRKDIADMHTALKAIATYIVQTKKADTAIDKNIKIIASFCEKSSQLIAGE